MIKNKSPAFLEAGLFIVGLLNYQIAQPPFSAGIIMTTTTKMMMLMIVTL